MRSFAIFAVAAALIAPVPAAWADGALAVGGGSFGFSRNHESTSHAEKLALDNCGNPQCHIVMTFSHSCAAYARSPNGHEGWAVRPNEEGARGRAIENCVEHGGHDCAVQTNLGYECDGF
ncbi:MAG TPA: DUF4189 domain-containing protein [Alphaproteobacteria bacterium]|nr:DUF4189 domain-containing protein [Alphaproteobacteria bacterium]